MQDSIQKFNEASQCLAPIIRTQVLKIPDTVKRDVREIRMSAGAPVMIVCSAGTMMVGADGRVGYICNGNFPLATMADIKETLNIACGYSLHSCQNSLAEGYVTLKGGHRVGIAARAVVENGAVKSIRDVSFLNIRIARQSKGVAADLYNDLFARGAQSVVIAGPPLSGKTTLLRDLARLLASIGGDNSYRVCVIDERDEIAAAYNGQAQNDIGLNACVLSGFPKVEGIVRAVRALSPQIILCDEIGTVVEAQAIAQGLNSGVSFVVTVHASGVEELSLKPQFIKLAETGAFKYVVILDGASRPCVIKRICRMEDFYDEVHRVRAVNGRICIDG